MKSQAATKKCVYQNTLLQWKGTDQDIQKGTRTRAAEGKTMRNSSRVRFVSRVSIVLPVVPEGTASNRVHDDEEDEEDDVNNSNLLPVVLDVGKDPSLARLAIVAEHRLVILPCVAVWIWNIR